MVRPPRNMNWRDCDLGRSPSGPAQIVNGSKCDMSTAMTKNLNISIFLPPSLVQLAFPVLFLLCEKGQMSTCCNIGNLPLISKTIPSLFTKFLIENRRRIFKSLRKHMCRSTEKSEGRGSLTRNYSILKAQGLRSNLMQG